MEKQKRTNRKLFFSITTLFVFTGFGIGWILKSFGDPAMWITLITGITTVVGVYCNFNHKDKKIEGGK